ncbi:hypothetical protein [Agrococcus jenensis]|uniref:O-antigen ligase-like membrane protein n=1 Tax=Agrococcus jenensis TaxID=46353 RepID=A0A3N2AWG8_9MICO|nr:hypothetical protein [Agrococcus jenensis]ROR67371.1 hypothetical protein EDD26_2782 [Agrococcus jenensis]
MSNSILVLAPLALCAGMVALFVFRASPRTTFVMWAFVLFLVPIWVGVTVSFFWAAITLVTLAAIASNFADVRLAISDAFVAVFALLVLILFALQLATLSHSVIAILQWVVPYAWGRMVLARVPALFVTRTIAAFATVAGILALVEFATGSNFFVLIPGPGPFAEWGNLQPRSDFLRAEGAFGHAIALGASLAMASAFVLGTRWSAPAIVLSLAVLVGAVVVSFSRIGIITVALTIAVSIVVMPGIRRAARWWVVVGGVTAIAILVPFLGDVFSDAGDEASGSADYRTGLLSLVSEVRLFGSAGDWQGRIEGGVYFGTFAGSVDNALLLIALRFGWVPVLLVAALLVALILNVLRGRANPASIAVVCQVPALFAVALITQFGSFLWFLTGLAVAWTAMQDDADALRDRSSQPLPVGLEPAGGTWSSARRIP